MRMGHGDDDGVHAIAPGSPHIDMGFLDTPVKSGRLDFHKDYDNIVVCYDG